eukprot:TRINITY_DN64608_c0_g2_i1.p1 TRINITY_DN64608_c0_g2~~TRINITY_DN64608_c0_g2_i1.p1  ORF type:complete len:1055 (-),score=160.84 TRINITY_DN64608_c0_g2_i1:182-3346(-)
MEDFTEDPRFGLPFVDVPSQYAKGWSDFEREGGPAIFFFEEVDRLKDEAKTIPRPAKTVPRLLLVSGDTIYITTKDGINKRCLEIKSLATAWHGLKDDEHRPLQLGLRMKGTTQHDVVVKLPSDERLAQCLHVIRTIHMHHVGRSLQVQRWTGKDNLQMTTRAEYAYDAPKLLSRKALRGELTSKERLAQSNQEILDARTQELRDELIRQLSARKDEELDQAGSALREAHTMLKQELEEKQKLQEQLSELQTELSASQIQGQSKMEDSSNLEELEKEVEESNATIAALKRTLEQKSEQLEQANEQLRNTTAATVSSQSSDEEKRQATLTHEADQHQIAMLLNQKTVLEADMAVLRQQHNEAADQLKVVHDKMAEICEELAKKDNELKQKDGELRELQSQLEDQRQRAAALQTELTQTVSKVAAAEETAATTPELQKLIDALKAEVYEKDMTIYQLKLNQGNVHQDTPMAAVGTSSGSSTGGGNSVTGSPSISPTSPSPYQQHENGRTDKPTPNSKKQRSNSTKDKRERERMEHQPPSLAAFLSANGSRHSSPSNRPHTPQSPSPYFPTALSTTTAATPSPPPMGIGYGGASSETASSTDGGGVVGYWGMEQPPTAFEPFFYPPPPPPFGWGTPYMPPPPPPPEYQQHTPKTRTPTRHNKMGSPSASKKDATSAYRKQSHNKPHRGHQQPMGMGTPSRQGRRRGSGGGIPSQGGESVSPAPPPMLGAFHPATMPTHMYHGGPQRASHPRHHNYGARTLTTDDSASVSSATPSETETATSDTADEHGVSVFGPPPPMQHPDPYVSHPQHVGPFGPTNPLSLYAYPQQQQQQQAMFSPPPPPVHTSHMSSPAAARHGRRGSGGVATQPVQQQQVMMAEQYTHSHSGSRYPTPPSPVGTPPPPNMPPSYNLGGITLPSHLQQPGNNVFMPVTPPPNGTIVTQNEQTFQVPLPDGTISPVKVSHTVFPTNPDQPDSHSFSINIQYGPNSDPSFDDATTMPPPPPSYLLGPPPRSYSPSRRSSPTGIAAVDNAFQVDISAPSPYGSPAPVGGPGGRAVGE